MGETTCTLYNIAKGAVVNQITKGDWVMQECHSRGRDQTTNHLRSFGNGCGSGSVSIALLRNQLRRHWTPAVLRRANANHERRSPKIINIFVVHRITARYASRCETV